MEPTTVNSVGEALRSSETAIGLTCVSISSRNERQHEREIVELNYLVSRVV